MTAINTYCVDTYGNSDGTIAYATGCHWAPGSNRPLTGMVNWCPPLAGLLTSDPDGSVATMMHEVVHALVRQTWVEINVDK